MDTVDVLTLYIAGCVVSFAVDIIKRVRLTNQLTLNDLIKAVYLGASSWAYIIALGFYLAFEWLHDNTIILWRKK